MNMIATGLILVVLLSACNSPGDKDGNGVNDEIEAARVRDWNARLVFFKVKKEEIQTCRDRGGMPRIQAGGGVSIPRPPAGPRTPPGTDGWTVPPRGCAAYSTPT